MSHPGLETVVEVPGSKSLTIRALFAAGLAHGTSALVNPLDAGDTWSARAAISMFGASIDDSGDEWRIDGVGGHPRPGTVIDAGESGLTARIAIAVAALAEGRTVITGSGRLPARPMEGITDAIGLMGATVESKRGAFPVVVLGSGAIPGGRVPVNSARSSQFATASLLVAPFADGPSEVVPVSLGGSEGYLDLTADVISAFGGRAGRTPQGFSVASTPLRGARFVVEPDASSAVYPLVAAAITGRPVTVANLGLGSRQPDMAILGVLESMGCAVEQGRSFVRVARAGGSLRPFDVDISTFPDAGVALAVAALFASGTSRLRGLRSLTYKESDRFAALYQELRRVGGGVRIEENDLLIAPGNLDSATVLSHGDHRIAMSFGLLELVNPGIRIDSPEVVAKTWPGFWDALEKLRRA